MPPKDAEAISDAARNSRALVPFVFIPSLSRANRGRTVFSVTRARLGDFQQLPAHPRDGEKADRKSERGDVGDEVAIAERSARRAV